MTFAPHSPYITPSLPTFPHFHSPATLMSCAPHAGTPACCPSAAQTKPAQSEQPEQPRVRVTASRLVCISRDRAVEFKTGTAQDDVDCVSDGALIIGDRGSILYAGPAAELPAELAKFPFAPEHDHAFPGQSVIPGLVDAHTHPVWAGDRVGEFRLKLAGAKYMDIHAMGGGIGFTVAHTRAASEDELLDALLGRLARALAAGTTLLEAKSGYGLEAEAELKMLRVIKRAKALQPIELVANYCGAHSVPKGSTAEAATEDVVSVQLPRLAAAAAAGEIDPEQIDVFCESGVFNVDQVRAIDMSTHIRRYQAIA
mgnify:CR=1 FL=1